jgi:hypothetical protein
MAKFVPKWVTQLTESYRVTRERDPKIGWILLGWFVVGGLAGALLTYLLTLWSGGGIAFPIISGVLFGLLAALWVFGSRAQKAAYDSIEGQPGAAAAALGILKKGWRTDPAIAVNKNSDLVHRVVGPPGIVLVGEGNPNRLKTLMSNERRRHERMLADIPIHEMVLGNGEGEVPLRKLVKTVQKMKRGVRPAEITVILDRLRAVDASRSAIPMPKGPIPTSMKGMRGNLRGR